LSKLRDTEHTQLVTEMRHRIAELELQVSISTTTTTTTNTAAATTLVVGTKITEITNYNKNWFRQVKDRKHPVLYLKSITVK